LKGTIFSLFNENTPLGKNYVFDIRRTCREVYDHTRRILYQQENKKIAKYADDEVNVTDAGIILNPSMSHHLSDPSIIKCKKPHCNVGLT
jgi:hypothetical protein